MSRFWGQNAKREDWEFIGFADKHIKIINV